MTYSIIAFDAVSGAFGAAVQSHWFNVAQTVPWVRGGVGAVLTQASTEPSYGWRGLKAMGEGMSPQHALDSLISDDHDADRRQVAFVDRTGDVAVHTGNRCLRHASHQVGEGWAVLGNLLTTDRVVPAMAGVFAEAKGSLPDRMLAALRAAETEGGDVRGVQSAAMKVCSPEDLNRAGNIDLSIADHPDPLGEMKRLVEVDRSYRALRRAEWEANAGDRSRAIDHLTQLRSDRDELGFWRGVGLARIGHLEEARNILDGVLVNAPRFREVLVRLVEAEPELAEVVDVARKQET